MSRMYVQYEANSPASATFKHWYRVGYDAAMSLVEQGGIFACPGKPVAQVTGAMYGPGFMEAERNLGRWMNIMRSQEQEHCPRKGLAAGDGHLHGWQQAVQDIIQKTEGPKFW